MMNQNLSEAALTFHRSAAHATRKGLVSRQVFLITRRIRFRAPGVGRDRKNAKHMKKEKSFQKPGRGRRAFKDTGY